VSRSRSSWASPRGYERSLEPIEPELGGRGASKSNASRSLIDATTEKLAAFVSRKLDDVDLVAMFIDGIEFVNHAVVIAQGVTIDGTKVPLGLWAGSTENAVVATALLQKVIEHGLRVDESMLFVVDGGKGLRKAVRDVFGDRAIVQRCQVHEAALLGPSLLVALAEEPLPKSSDASDTRQRAFSLLVTAYDEVRRAVTFVRWAENDVDAFAPSLYAKSRKRRPGAGDDDDGDMDGGDAVAPVVSPPDATPS